MGQNSSPDRVNHFLFSTESRPALGPTQPPIQWVPSALPSVVKRLGRKSDHSSPTSAEGDITYEYTPPYILTVYCFISYSQGKLYLHLTPPATVNSDINLIFLTFDSLGHHLVFDIFIFPCLRLLLYWPEFMYRNTRLLVIPKAITYRKVYSPVRWYINC
jgi:hypothetical protein